MPKVGQPAAVEQPAPAPTEFAPIEQPATAPVERPDPAPRQEAVLDIQRAVKELVRLMEKINGHGHSMHRVFEDFLELGIAALIADDERYHKARADYGRPELELFSQALGVVMREAQAGYHDVIGPTYEELGSRRGRAGFGQFFTPWPIAVMMGEMTLGDVKPKADGSPLTIHDPACGAGVLLLAAADVIERRCPELLRTGKVAFYGVDIDHTCYLMARLNLIVHGLSEQAKVLAAVLSAPERARREVEARQPQTEVSK